MTAKRIVRIAYVLVRVVIFIPSVIRVLTSLNAFSGSTNWIRPVASLWYLPAFSGLLGILSLMPYCDFLFRRSTRAMFLAVIVATSCIALRFAIFPYYYASDAVFRNPQHLKEFQAAQLEVDGFRSERTENGVTIWHVSKPIYEVMDLIPAVGFSIAPLILFFLRQYELKCASKSINALAQ